jgi:uncharacterized repeat protein (TIGR01451 family)
VGRASISKSFDRSTIKLGEREVVAVSIFVQSTGTAPINSATVEDEVPEGFEVRAVKVELDDSNVRKDVTASARVSVDEGVATFTLKDIRSAFGKPMEKGDYFEVSYELVSNGAIEGTYETDVRGWANTDPAGSRITLERTEEAPLMKVTKSLQGIFVSKDLVSTQNDDEIKFVIYVKNKGHVPMTDVVLRDLFPKGFDLVRSSDEFKVVQATDKGSVVEWTIARLDVNEEHRVTYVLKGAGEYSISEAVVMIGG